MNYYLKYFIAAIGLFAFSGFFAIFGVYAERKVSAFIQDRLGPMETGKYGVLQTVADLIKLLLKELITPSAADKLLFMLAPGIIFIAVYMGFAAIPWSSGLAPSNLNLGLYYIFAIISIETLGILMAGWGSNNKYSVLGAMRSAAQIVSYEIPAGFAIISVVMIAQTLNLQTISAQQGILSSEHSKFLGIWDVTANGGILSWNIFRAPHRQPADPAQHQEGHAGRGGGAVHQGLPRTRHRDPRHLHPRPARGDEGDDPGDDQVRHARSTRTPSRCRWRRPIPAPSSTSRRWRTAGLTPKCRTDQRQRHPDRAAALSGPVATPRSSLGRGFYRRFYFRVPKIASIVGEMVTQPDMMKRRLREGVEFFRFLKERRTIAQAA